MHGDVYIFIYTERDREKHLKAKVYHIGVHGLPGMITMHRSEFLHLRPRIRYVRCLSGCFCNLRVFLWKSLITTRAPLFGRSSELWNLSSYDELTGNFETRNLHMSYSQYFG